MKTTQEIKDYLGSYQKVQQELQALIIQRERILVKGTSINSVLSDMPKSKDATSKIEHTAIELADMSDIENKIAQCKQTHKEITATIYAIQDSEQRAVLIHRYISGMAWEEICSVMHYGWDSVHYRHRAALSSLLEVHIQSDRNVH